MIDSSKKVYKTFDEWNLEGRRIHKGEKATLMDGKLVFHKGQTYDPNFHLRVSMHLGGVDGPWSDQPF